MARHNELGKEGERIAREYLISNGYTIIDIDTRKGHYELDIVATRGDRIIFTEVKSRTMGSQDPIDAITPNKIRKICRAADSFVRNYGFPHEVQFDVITVVVAPDGNYKLEHIPDAFYPPINGGR